MTLNEDGMMSLGRDARMFRGVVTVLQTCDRIATGGAADSSTSSSSSAFSSSTNFSTPQISSMTPERLTGVYETVFGAGLSGHELANACESGMMETRFYTE